ncbi:sec-independent protein translocase protein TatC [Arthrobacter sp. cf158]|nr:sec-independent protein translocase protein TatC [Arthrobacter sp. cf158]
MAGQGARGSGRKGNPEARMALLEHLKELRTRLFRAGIGVIGGTVLAFIVYQPLLDALIEPIKVLNEKDGRASTLNFDGVASSFDLMIQVSVFLGLILASPVWIYQLWAYIVPGLHKKERRMALAFVAAAVPLFLAGILLAWLVLPNAVRVLTEFTPTGGSNFISATTYLAFVLRLLLAFGISFLVPVVLVGLNLAGVIKGVQLIKSWRITLFLVCLFAAMAAPGGDAMSMFYLAAPMLLLFFVAIGICLLNDRRRARRSIKRSADIDASAAQATPAPDLESL